MKKALIITSIADDQHPVLNQFAKECRENSIDFIVIGDTKSPEHFNIDGCDFWSINDQRLLPFELSLLIPTKHYSRKNIGYLLAINNGAEELAETDDDNIPIAGFWNQKSQQVNARSFQDNGWVNVYHYFTKNKIWPRGFPLEELNNEQVYISSRPEVVVNCPIQQGLADQNPDVDAIFRLTHSLPLSFESKAKLALGRNSWSPFNSQNTYWFKEAFPLLYLPSYCSFRMTDIWRSYVAQRIAWEGDWSILYHDPTVMQERNEHDLMSDFEDEIIGYKNNLKICEELKSLSLKKGKEYIFDNLITCYQKLIDIGVLQKEEMILLNAWVNDLKKI